MCDLERIAICIKNGQSAQSRGLVATLIMRFVVIIKNLDTKDNFVMMICKWFLMKLA
jgi:hypothetical protein